jgi:hypothetical protein
VFYECARRRKVGDPSRQPAIQFPAPGVQVQPGWIIVQFDSAMFTVASKSLLMGNIPVVNW